MPLTSAAALYPYLPGLDSGADADLTTLITRAESSIADYLGFPPATVGGAAVINSAAYTLYLDAPMTVNERVLQLPVKPITAVASVHDDALWAYGSSELVASSQYTIVGELGQIWLNPDATHAWSKSFRAIRVILTAGFAGANPDSALTVAILEYAALLYERRKGGAGRRRASAGGVSSDFDLPPIPDAVRQLLRPYRMPSHWLS